MAVAVIFVDHGSRIEEANRLIETLTMFLAGALGGELCAVLPAHMELAQPDLQAAFMSARHAGADEVLVLPLFLTTGKHLRFDIPALCKDAAVKAGNIEWRLGAEMLSQPILIEAIRQWMLTEVAAGVS